MRRLQQRFPGELLVLGVHTAKFPHERDIENVRQAVNRLGITHPVVNDTGSDAARSSLWQEYCVRGWPTVALLDPSGYMIAKKAGEIQTEMAIELLETLLLETLLLDRPVDPAPPLVSIRHEASDDAPDNKAAPSALRFPSKVLVDGDRLWIADSGHHRILETASPDAHGRARVLRVYGSGEPGLVDGAASTARFHHPRGLTRTESTLYVADTDNHAVRAIDLDGAEHRTVRTVLGTGEMGRSILKRVGAPLEAPLRSPWDVHAAGDLLFIAMAGAHQIWTLKDETRAMVLAGSGREALQNGPLHLAAFNQPSGLAIGDDVLYVADPEASAVRAITFDDTPQVRTLVGVGLFAFGDLDGEGTDVRLQHPTDVAWWRDRILIADTYNHKIKQLDPPTRIVRTLIGTGQIGASDGDFATATFFEPEGLDVDDSGRLYIADTNNHRVRVADLESGRVTTLSLDFSDLP